MFKEQTTLPIIQPGMGEIAGRTPRHSNPRKIVSLSQLKKSTRLAIYLYILAHYKLHERQLEYIAHFQAKLNLDEIQSALKFVHVLTTDQRTRSRMHVGEHHDEIHNVKLVPFSQPRPKPPDQRRIGVGYRDKGSLPKQSRPSWDKENERAVSISENIDHWSYLTLKETLEDKETESVEVLSRLRKNYPEASYLLENSALKLSNPEKGCWKITQSKSPYS